MCVIVEQFVWLWKEVEEVPLRRPRAQRHLVIACNRVMNRLAGSESNRRKGEGDRTVGDESCCR